MKARFDAVQTNIALEPGILTINQDKLEVVKQEMTF